ncbi:MAG: hypothetical protein K8S14_08680 [Actinomycetia bacterium]|nr:hypothetical protein [Actinomycetes bacterium]
MNVIKLKIAGSLPGDLTFELIRDGRNPLIGKATMSLTLEELTTSPSIFREFLTNYFGRELRQWVFDNPTPGLLAIISEDRHLDGIPWEYLPRLLQLPTVFVTRLLNHSEPNLDRSVQDPCRLLAAGWSGWPFTNLPGIQKELNALSQLGIATAYRVRALFEPSLIEFEDAYSSIQPDILHLVPPAICSDNEMPTMATVTLPQGEGLKWIPIDEIVSCIPHNLLPRLVVLNACYGAGNISGSSAIREFTETLNVVTFGWLGEIHDLASVDFALFFYNRLIEGGTIIDALHAYRSLQLYYRSFEQAQAPVPEGHYFAGTSVVWTPSLTLLTNPLLERSSEEIELRAKRESRAKNGPTTLGFASYSTAKETSTPTVEVEFESMKWLNPALLKNGYPAIFHMIITSDRMLRNVVLAITCDTGNGTSTIRQTLNLLRGPQPIRIDTLQFPVLYELIEAAVPRRQINLTMICSYAGVVLAEITKSLLWMGLAEWLDKKETWCYIPAFVDPFANGVLDVIDEADSVLKKLVSPTSAFSGYQNGDRGFIEKQVEAVFSCLRDDPFQLNYINPPPIPVYKPDDQFASGQRVRSPDEVIERHRGTCHDLAILFASCLEHIGIYPLIILIQGHTFVGFWMDAKAHQDYWRQTRGDVMWQPQVPGREWTIVDLEELRKLEEKKSVCFVEVTEVTNRNAQFMNAIQTGHDHLKRLENTKEWFDVAIDIQASRFRIQPL